MSNGLGRRLPGDMEHVEKYPFSAVAPDTVGTVNHTMKLPQFHWDWDQGSEGACVGFGTSMMMSVRNQFQAYQLDTNPKTHRYDPWWLWDRAKEIDEWPDTNPGDDEGTSVRAGCDVLRQRGHVRVIQGKDRPEDISEGITTNRWAVSVDELRTALSGDLPISLGINWYQNFDRPELVGSEYWIGRDVNHLGSIRGGHCVCLYGASDRRQAFRVKNSWGRDFPLVWVPYLTVQRLINEDG
jgi:hypothetical protein